jgi:hypothetical protein
MRCTMRTLILGLFGVVVGEWFSSCSEKKVPSSVGKMAALKSLLCAGGPDQGIWAVRWGDSPAVMISCDPRVNTCENLGYLESTDVDERIGSTTESVLVVRSRTVLCDGGAVRGGFRMELRLSRQVDAGWTASMSTHEIAD